VTNLTSSALSSALSSSSTAQKRLTCLSTARYPPAYRVFLLRSSRSTPVCAPEMRICSSGAQKMPSWSGEMTWYRPLRR
jgi:hypothetical protein